METIQPTPQSVKQAALKQQILAGLQVPPGMTVHVQVTRKYVRLFIKKGETL